MRYFLATGLFIYGMALLGQEGGTITGVVRDAADGKSMVAVNISADRRTGTITGQDGEFSLQLTPGHHQIEFYYVGYKRVSKEVTLERGGSVHLEIDMVVSSRMLDEVVVTAGKFEQKLSDVTVSMEVIKPRQLSNQNITSLDMILERTSGISILDGQPSIRGGSGFSLGVGSRVLMLVDDLPMLSGDAGDVKWNYLPVENVNQVEVIKGASSVLYGSSALNGVINLRTSIPGNDPRTEVTLFGGVYMNPRREELIWWDRNHLNTGISVSHLRKIRNLELSAGGNYLKDEGYRELEFEDRVRGNLGLRYRFSKVKGLSAGLTTSAMYVDQADFYIWMDADSGAYRQSPESYARMTGYRFNIDPFVEYFTERGDKHTLRTRLYSVGNAVVDASKNSFSKVWYGEYRYQKKFRERVHWTSGVSFMRNTVLAGLFNDHKGSNSAIYTQLDINMLSRLKVSSGVRWEVNSLNGKLYHSLPVVRAGINFQAGQATFLRGSFGQGYRFPSVAEKFADAVVGDLKIFPNPDLEPEKGWAAELGIKQGFALGSWKGMADLAIFWTEYKNMIEYTFGYHPPDSLTRPPFEYVGFKNLNIENARIIGSELSVNGQGALGPIHLDLTAGYTIMDPVDPVLLDSIGRTGTEAYVLKYRRRHLVKSDLEVEAWRIFTGINVQYNSRMINVDEAFIDTTSLKDLLLPGFSDYWYNTASGYTLVDFRMGWNISPAFRVVAILRNAFNIEYLGRPGDIGPPRHFTLQLRLTF